MLPGFLYIAGSLAIWTKGITHQVWISRIGQRDHEYGFHNWHMDRKDFVYGSGISSSLVSCSNGIFYNHWRHDFCRRVTQELMTNHKPNVNHKANRTASTRSGCLDVVRKIMNEPKQIEVTASDVATGTVLDTNFQWFIGKPDQKKWHRRFADRAQAIECCRSEIRKNPNIEFWLRDGTPEGEERIANVSQ